MKRPGLLVLLTALVAFAAVEARAQYNNPCVVRPKFLDARTERPEFVLRVPVQSTMIRSERVLPRVQLPDFARTEFSLPVFPRPFYEVCKFTNSYAEIEEPMDINEVMATQEFVQKPILAPAAFHSAPAVAANPLPASTPITKPSVVATALKSITEVKPSALPASSPLSLAFTSARPSAPASANGFVYVPSAPAEPCCGAVAPAPVRAPQTAKVN